MNKRCENDIKLENHRLSSHHGQGKNKNIVTGLTFCGKKYQEHSGRLTVYYNNCCGVHQVRNNMPIWSICETGAVYSRLLGGELVSFWMGGESQLARHVLGMNLLQRECVHGLWGYAKATLTDGVVGSFWFGVRQESRQQENGGQQLSPANNTCYLHIPKERD